MTPAEFAFRWHCRTARALVQLDEPYNPREPFAELSAGVVDVLEAVAESLLGELDDELEADVEIYRAALARARERRSRRVEISLTELAREAIADPPGRHEAEIVDDGLAQYDADEIALELEARREGGF